ncbi:MULTISPECIES: hypothetical protein [Paenibacillus]|uniref:HTH merR-type domain-containing protein n=2 Tax=Paenibacillus TaxID=44249 RepID=A0ABX2ZBG1_PAEPO|nr:MULTISPECIES: hypothetical protein [Paenibacillus]MBJ8190812.1 hypothetical protein [Bacillus cereus]MDR6781435.1 putative transcriptional regulator/outer membrane murein-binding lipoprotein Lpp [Paenibacillus peoriae]ODA08189.1 hypothetical protein A7312_28135 [Paenibacillus polymyxa]OME64507.1 hypothetical protein BK119_26330 [Paenibacillus peoriae]
MNSTPLNFIYSTVQVAKLLDIGRSTVNKYARSLENAGYVFTKDDKDHRAFTDHDIIAFKALLDLLARGAEYESAVNATVERYSRVYSSDSVSLVATPDSSTEVAMLNAKVDDLISAVAALSNRIDEIVDEKVRLQVAAAASGIGDQVNGVLEEVRQAQDRADQQLTEIAGAVSRLELHGRRKRFFGLF